MNPGPINPKNIGLSPATQALGLGDALVAQVKLQNDELKKKQRETAKTEGFGQPYSLSNNILFGLGAGNGT
jgi:hypothetical protein